jgi:mannose/fructose/N-acetylgalactosamine-specific phosphotransferase system component IID
MSNAPVRLLNKKDVRKAWLNWMWFFLSTQNMERMQAPAVIRTMWTAKDKLYPNNKEAQKELMQRHTPFFNTEPVWGGMILGITLGMEEERAMGSDVPDELITSIKTALMGPFAGLFDSLFQATLVPILLSIGLGMSAESGSVAGPLFYVVAFWAIVPTISWFLFHNGYKAGISGAQVILESGIKERVISAANIIGLVVIGAVTAQISNINTGLKFKYQTLVVDLNVILNGIQPKILVLLMVFLTYYLMVKRKLSINKIFLLYFLLAVVGYFTKILA